MDLYQTLKYYNPMWSKREIVCFCIIVFVAVLFFIRAVQKRTQSFPAERFCGRIFCISNNRNMSADF